MKQQRITLLIKNKVYMQFQRTVARMGKSTMIINSARKQATMQKEDAGGD